MNKKQTGTSERPACSEPAFIHSVKINVESGSEDSTG